jgi:hypothetical protein
VADLLQVLLLSLPIISPISSSSTITNFTEGNSLGKLINKYDEDNEDNSSLSQKCCWQH